MHRRCPSVLISGARQTGKSILLQHIFPDAKYITLDRPLDAQDAESNPESFIAQLKSHNRVIIDEIQNAPTLFHEIKIAIDQDRSFMGRWILTGSQKFSLMKGVSESLAGRIAIVELDSLSPSEVVEGGLDVDRYLLVGGYPELWTQSNVIANEFYRDYVSSYLERDLRSILAVNDLRDFDRFIRSCALRVGQLVNFTEISGDVGIKSPTGKRWFEVLVASGIIGVVEPAVVNDRKRLVKSPKFYFRDVVFLNFYLDIRSFSNLESSPHLGQIWENLVYCCLLRMPEIDSRDIRFARDKQRNEIDFLVTTASGDRYVIEAKAHSNPDLSKISFEKIIAETMFNGSKAVACRLESDCPRQMGDVMLYNPLRHQLPF